MRIEEAAARTQARIDSGSQTIVGVNKYRLEKEDPIDILEIDNTAVRNEQIELLKELRANRDERSRTESIGRHHGMCSYEERQLAGTGCQGSRLACITGRNLRCLRKVVVGRYKAIIRTISGVYSSETKKDADFQKACELTAEVCQERGSPAAYHDR